MLKKKYLKRKKDVFDVLDFENKNIPKNPSLISEEIQKKYSEFSHFSNEFEKSLEEKDFRVGDVVNGKITEIKEDYVLVDINYKSEGLIPIAEFGSDQEKGEGEGTSLNGLEGFYGEESSKDQKPYSVGGEEASQASASQENAFHTEKEPVELQPFQSDYQSSRRFERGGRTKGRFKGGRGRFSQRRRDESFLPQRLDHKKRADILKNIELGAEVQVYIEKIENENGRVVLSKNKAYIHKVWNDISKAVDEGTPVDGKVIEKVKGGLSIDVGMKGFLPGSQIDIRPVRDMDYYVGRTYKFKVIKFNKRRGNVVLSRRALLEEKRENLRFETLNKMKEGSIVKGVVKSLTDYGAFIDLGGMDGLLHITDMSWSRIKHPSEILKENQEVDVEVLRFDTEKGRVSLGLKQLKDDPWKKVEKMYPIGQRVKGKVMSLTEYGAFIELDEGVEGLIHISEMSWLKRLKHPSQILTVAQEIDIQVLEIDVRNRRISLGIKQLQPNPWEQLKEKYPVGTVIEGEVKSLTEFGMFMRVDEGIDGLVHISDFSWTRRINHPSEEFKRGDRVKAVVLGVDIKGERFSLGIKQLETNPWSDVDVRYPIGSRHKVKVIESTDFGVFVELEKSIEGLIHISELSTKRVEKPEDIVRIGESIEAEITSIDKEARKIGLSVKVIKLREQQEGSRVHSKNEKKNESSSRTPLGEALGEQLEKFEQVELAKKKEEKREEKKAEMKHEIAGMKNEIKEEKEEKKEGEGKEESQKEENQR